MIDIHTHILPGMDDGAVNLDQSLEMIDVAVQNGITAIVATPHMLPERTIANKKDQVLSLTKELREVVRSRGLSLELYPGGEVYATPDIVKRLTYGEILTYNDSNKYLLLEMARDEVPGFMSKVIFELKLIGITPIIAHPERNQGIIRRPECLYHMVEQGALAQITASSLRSGSAFYHTGELLLKCNLIHFIASDAHDTTRRAPRLSIYKSILEEIVGEFRANQILMDNPRAVLSGDELEQQPEPLSTISTKKRRLFGISFI